MSQIGDDVIAVEAAASKGIYLWDYLTNEFKFFRSLSNAKSIPTSAHVKISTEWLNIGKHSRPFLLNEYSQNTHTSYSLPLSPYCKLWCVWSGSRGPLLPTSCHMAPSLALAISLKNIKIFQIPSYWAHLLLGLAFLFIHGYISIIFH